MPSIASLLAISGFACLVTTSQAIGHFENRDGTFSIDQVAGPAFVKNGAAALSKAYHRYNKRVPSNVAAAAAATVTTTVVVKPEHPNYDRIWLTPIKVGSQTLMMELDTTTPDFWVFSDLLPKAQKAGHSVYKTSASKLKQGLTWFVAYGGDYLAQGTVYADKVVVGGVTATSQAVEAATSVSTGFTKEKDLDGIVGLGFRSLNTVRPDQQLTWFENIKSTLKAPLFTATLKKGKAGTYDFGYIDDCKYTGSIAYTDISVGSKIWQISPDGYAIGSAKATNVSITANVATGIPFLLLPDSINEAYYSQVQGAVLNSTQGGWVFPCSSNLPSFSLIIEGQRRTVPGSYLNYNVVDGSTCYGGLQSDSDIGLSIIGATFLKGQFVVFDQSQSTPRVGFAQQADI